MALALSLNKDSTPQSTPPPNPIETTPTPVFSIPEKIEPRIELQQELKEHLLENAFKLLTNDTVAVVSELLLRYAGKDEERYSEAINFLCSRIKTAIKYM